MPGFSDNYFLDNLDAMYGSDKARDKQRKLDQRTAEKEAKLGTTNSLTGTQLQQELSAAVDEQLYERDGQWYKTQWVPGLDAHGELTMSGQEVSVDPGVNRFGSADVRNLYIDDTAEGDYKLGLARTNVNPEFISPWTNEPITPYEARYLDKQGVEGVYLGNQSSYNGTPGPMGVTPEDGALLDITLQDKLATDLEYKVHSNLGQMANRSIGQGAVTQADIANYGGGKTEYTTDQAPMWNDAAAIPTTLQGDTPLPGNPYDKRAARLNFDGSLTQAPAQAEQSDFTDNGRIENLVAATQYGLGRTAAGIADAIMDFGSRVAIETGTDPKLFGKGSGSIVANYYDEKGNFTGLDDYKEAKEYGYDNTRTREATENLGKAWDSGDKMQMAAAVIEGILTAGPEFFLESAGEMAGALHPAAMVGLAAKYSNDMLEDRAANLKEGEELTNVDRLIAAAISGPLVYLNKLGVDEMIGKTKVIKGILGGLTKTKSPSAMANGIKAVGAAALTVIGKAGYEGLEEVAQESLQKFVETYGEETAKKFFSDEVGKELFQAFGGGVAGGAGMAGPVAVKDLASQALGGETVDNLKQKIKGIKESLTPEIDAEQETTAIPTPMTDAVKESPYEASSAMFKEVVAGIDAEAKAAGLTRDEVFNNKPEEFRADFNSMLNEVSRQKMANAVRTGKTDKLNATPEDEFAIIAEYSNIVDDKQAAEFEANIAISHVNDPDMAGIVTKAKEVRAMRKELNGLVTTGEQVAVTGIDPERDNRQGFLKYFNDAVNSPIGSVERQASTEELLRFTSLQQTKYEKLIAGREEATSRIADRMTKIIGEAARRNKTIDEKTLWEAMVKASPKGNGVTVAMRNSYQGSLDKVLAAGVPLAELDLNSMGYHTFEYASKEYNRKNDGFGNRTDGTFEVDPQQSLIDFAKLENYNMNGVAGIWHTGSSISKTIEATGNEVAAMTKAHALLKSHEETATKAPKETTPSEAQREPTKAKPAEEVQTPAEEVKEPTEAPKKSNKPTGEEIRKARLYNIAHEMSNGYKLSDIDTQFAKDNAAEIKSTILEDENLSKAYFALKKRLDANKKKADPKTQEKTPTEPVEAQEEDKQPTSPVKEEKPSEAPKKAKQKPLTETKFVQDYLDVDMTSADFGDLIEVAGKQVGTTKESKEVQEAVNAKREDAKARLHSMVNGKALSPKRRAALRARVDKLIARSGYLKDELNAIDTNMNSVTEFLDGTKTTLDELRELRAEQKALSAEWDKADSGVNNAYKRIRKLVKQFEARDTRKGYSDADLKIDEDLEYSEVTSKLHNYINALEADVDNASSLRIAVAKVLKSLSHRITIMLETYEKFFARRETIKVEQADIKAKIKAIKANAEELYGPNWRDSRNAIFGKFSELKGVKVKTQLAKNKLKGVNKTMEQLAVVHSDKTSVGKAPDSEVTVPNALGKAIGTGTATTELGARDLTEADINTVFNTGELDRFIEASGINGINKVRGKKGFSEGPVTDADRALYPYLMLLMDADGNMNENIAVASKAAALGYIAENFDTLTQLSVRDIQSFYGYTDENWMMATKEQFESGIPSVHIVDNVAKEIGKMLGLKAKIEYDKDGNKVADYTELYEKVTLGLAYTAIKHLEHEGILEEKSFKYKDTDKDVHTYKMAPALAGNIKDKIAISDHVKRVEEHFNIEVEDKVRVHTAPRDIKIEDVKKRNEPYTDVSPTVAEAIVNNEKQKWMPSVDAINMLLDIPTENLAKILGKKDDKEKGLTKEESISRVGKNRQVEMDIENLTAMKDAIDNGDASGGVYFRWFVAQSGREMIDAEGGFNPQSIKLHRYLVTTEGQRGIVDKTKDPISETIFKLGIAQALGFKADKMSIEESEKFADTILADQSNLDKIKAGLDAGIKEIEVAGVVVKVEEIAHTATALIEGANYIAAKGKAFETSMTFEIDGLTNGFGHKMLQYLVTSNTGFTVNDNAIKWLNKVGFTFKSREEASDMVSNIQNGAKGGIVDAYITLGEKVAPAKGSTMTDKVKKRFDTVEKDRSTGEVVPYELTKRASKFGTISEAKALKKAKALESVMPALYEEDGTLAGFVRDLMKPPFMTFGYAAGFQSMSNNMAASFIDEVMHKVLNSEAGDVEIAAFVEALGYKKSVNEFKQELLDKTYAQIVIPGNKDIKGPANVLEAFRGLIRGVYGDAVEDVMTTEFGAFRDINKAIIDNTNITYYIFKAAYDRKLLEKEVTDGAPSKEIHDEIMKELEAEELLPTMKGPDSKSFKDGIALYDTKSEIAATNKYGEARTYQHGDKNGRGVKGKRREFTGPGAKGVVLLTQYTDGLGTARNTLNNDVLQVFDAYVIGVNQSNVAEQANADFINDNLNQEWTQLGASVEALTRMVNNATNLLGLDILKEAKELHAEDNAVKFGTEVELADSKILPAVQQLHFSITMNDALESRRADMKRKNFLAEQFVLTKEQGFEYNGKEELNKSLAKDIHKFDSTLDADKVLEDLADIMTNAMKCD